VGRTVVAESELAGVEARNAAQLAQLSEDSPLAASETAVSGPSAADISVAVDNGGIDCGAIENANPASDGPSADGISQALTNSVAADGGIGGPSGP
jgi:hypothetical protein